MFSLNLEDIRIALRDLSGIFRIVSFVFLAPLPVTLYGVVNDFAGGVVQDAAGIAGRISMFLIPALILYLLHLILERVHTAGISTKTRHAMISVALGWLVIALVGSLPYILSGTLGPVDAFFESMSGWTTTGMTMIECIEPTPADILFYRSLTQWVGGVGIIVMALMVFMRKGTVAMVYYSSERGKRRIRPSIRGTVNETWKIYGVYTIACMILLYLAGMTPFDAVNHSLTTLPTGGFSTHTESIGYFHDKPLIEPILIVFMLIGAISFLIHFRIFEGKSSHLLENIESKNLIAIVLASTAILSVVFFISGADLSAIRISLFQAVAIITTTGFATAEVSQWPALSKTLLLVLMVIGGSYGSTGSGMKILRVVVIIKTIFYSLRKFMLPKTAMVRLKLDSKPINYDEITYVMAFVMSYLGIALIGIGIFSAMGYGAYESASLSLSSIGNVGPVYLTMEDWFGISEIGKLTMIFLMWIGRLEIFPVLILLNSIFVKRRHSL